MTHPKHEQKFDVVIMSEIFRGKKFPNTQNIPSPAFIHSISIYEIKYFHPILVCEIYCVLAIK